MTHISQRVRFGTRENPTNVPTPTTQAGWWNCIDPATPRQLEWFRILAARAEAQPESLALIFGSGYVGPSYLSKHAVSFGIHVLQNALVDLGVCHDVDETV